MKPPKVLGRVGELDGLRAVAILLVLVQHYLVSTTMFTTVLGPFLPVLATTWSGVDLFFVLSGFLIGGILIDNRSASNVFGVFFIRRACRILPLYLTMVLAYIVINAAGVAYNHWLFQQQLPTWSYLTFTQNFFMARLGWFGAAWLGATWSLAIEEQFYLVIPFLLILLPRRVAVGVMLAGVIAAPIARVHFTGLGPYVLPPAHCGGLFLGVLCAFIVRSAMWTARLRTWRWSLLALLPFCLAFTAWAIATGASGTIADIHLAYDVLYPVILLLAIAWRGAAPTAALRGSVMGWIGARSYALYLLHQPVLGTVHTALLGGDNPRLTTAPEVWATLLSLILTLALAELSYRFLERPFLEWGARHKFQKAASAEPVLAQSQA